MQRKPRVRTVPTCFEVYRGKRLLGWVETRMYRNGAKCEWTISDLPNGGQDQGRAASLKAAVSAMLKAIAAPEPSDG